MTPVLTESALDLPLLARGKVRDVYDLGDKLLIVATDRISAFDVILPDACTLLDYMLDMFTGIVRGMQVYPERMRENMEASYGLPFSQRVLLGLIDKGLKRQDAYKIVQRNAMRAWEERKPFLDLLCDEPDVTAHISRDELASIFDYGFHLRHVDDSFRRLGL